VGGSNLLASSSAGAKQSRGFEIVGVIGNCPVSDPTGILLSVPLSKIKRNRASVLPCAFEIISPIFARYAF
jgi:hypothetical protein